MGCFESKQKNKKEQQGGLHHRSLQNLANHRTSSPINRSQSTMEHFMSNRERTAMLAHSSISATTRLLLSAPFSAFSAFDEQLYLTGIGGITLDNLKQHHIKTLVNVAEEIPALELPESASVVAVKYPVRKEV